MGLDLFCHPSFCIMMKNKLQSTLYLQQQKFCMFLISSYFTAEMYNHFEAKFCVSNPIVLVQTNIVV